MLPEKGLENRPGQNNCFLNVCIQALWHLGAFRSQFLTSKDHVHKENSCIYCALKVLFNGYQFSEEQVLPPTALRNTLAVLHRGLDRFQVGELDDAAEALEAILTCLNKVYLVKGNERAKKADESNPNSISNKVFGCPVVEIVQCGKCKKEIKPQGSDSFIYYTYVTEVREEHKKYPDLQFDNLLKRLSDGVTRSCPNDKCEEKKCTVRKVLLQQPHVFAVGLVWPTPNPTAYEIVDMLSIISQQIRLSNIFNGVPVQFTYRLKGMICYYGLHYDCYFYSPQRKQWLVFDDRVVKEVGASWEELKDRCRRGRFHPSVLFYERVETGAPLPTTFTPKFNPQPITLNRNMFTASGPAVPGFSLAPPSAAYPGMPHPAFSPYHPHHPGFARGYMPPGYAPAHPHQQQHPPNGMPTPAAVAPALQQQQQQERAENERRQEMAERAEAERRKRQKEAEEQQQQQQKEAEDKRRREEEQRRQQQAAAAVVEQSSDEEGTSGDEDERSEEEEEEGETGGESEREAAAKRLAMPAPRAEPPKSLPAPLVPTYAPPPASPSPPALTGSSSSISSASAPPSAPPLSSGSPPVITSSPSSPSVDASPSAPPLSSRSPSPPVVSSSPPPPVMVEDLLSTENISSAGPPPVMVEDLLSTKNAVAVSSPVPALHRHVPTTTSATTTAATTASAPRSAPYTPSFTPAAVAARAQQPPPHAYAELNFPSVPTALPSAPTPSAPALHSSTQAPSAYSHSTSDSKQQQPSIIGAVDSYDDYSSKIDSIGQSRYLSLSKPAYSSSSSTPSTYSRPSTTASLFSSSSSSSSSSTRPTTASLFSSSSSSSSASRATFGASTSSSSSAATAPKKKPQTSAFTNLSSLLSN